MDKKPQGRFLILDGNSLLHRAFYAIPLLSNRQGVFTNGVYGFINMLNKVLELQKPDYLAVAFDKGKKTFRHGVYEAYKGKRKSTPEELRPQFALLKEVLGAMNIPIFELDDYEADDIIATLVRQAEDLGMESLIVTGDRDAWQLISPKIQVLLTRKGISELEIYNEETLKNKFGLRPDQVPDLKGLMGDASDNIPGIPGVGEKTALKLLAQYERVENILANREKVKGSLGEKLANFGEQALLSKQLATLSVDIDLEPEWERCRYGEPDYPRLLQIYKELDFKTLINQVLARMGPAQGNRGAEKTGTDQLPLAFKRVEKAEELEEWVAEVKNCGQMALYFQFQGPPRTAVIQGVALACGPDGALVWSPASPLPQEDFWNLLRPLLADPTVLKIGHDFKAIYLMLQNRGISLEGTWEDPMIASYLLNPGTNQHSLPQASLEHMGMALPPDAESEEYWARCVQAAWRLAQRLRPKLEEAELASLYHQVEIPLAQVLAEMEREGVRVDPEILFHMAQELGEGIEALTGEIYGLAGEEFNINSTQQLAVILFEKLGLKPIKKTKTGYSTSAEVLEELASQHEMVAKILEYRQLVKLKSTYVDGLRGLIDPHTGKIHTTFNQTITATGRLSSTDPNLQNIPIRLEEGRRIRKVFLPSESERVILAADYSQIELRVLAHISGDENLIGAFARGEDIHTRTASEVFGVPMEEVTREMRSRAKAVNFGIVYGISDFGLARDIGVSRKEAKAYIDSYFRRYPGVRAWIDRVIGEAREKGYVTTLLQRRRYLPDLFSSNRNIRNFGERTAMNTPIQGSAADIIKLAMLRIAQAMKEKELASRMILQVHDELIFDVPKKELEALAYLVREAMEKAVQMRVPLVVDLKVGPNWYDLAPYQG